MKFKDTRASMCISGACYKTLVRNSDGKLAVCKSRFSDNSHDYEAELMIKSIADFVGLRCCDVIVQDGMLYSIFNDNYKIKTEVESLGDVPTHVSSIFQIARKYSDSDASIMSTLAESLLFDVVTRQLDRNLTNIAFIMMNNGIISLYPMYDNGLSLFSSVPYRDDKEYRTVIGTSEEIIRECLKYDVSRVTSWNITENILSVLWESIPDVLISGINKKDIIYWVVSEYNYVVSRILDSRHTNEDNPILELFKQSRE